MRHAPQNITWQDGKTRRAALRGNPSVHDVISQGAAAASTNRSYFTDGTLPDYERRGVPHDSPGTRPSGCSGSMAGGRIMPSAAAWPSIAHLACGHLQACAHVCVGASRPA